MKPLPQQRIDEIHAMIKAEILKFSDRLMDEIRVMHEFGHQAEGRALRHGHAGAAALPERDVRDAYVVLAIFAVMFGAFGLAMWSLFRSEKTDEFEDLRLAFKDLEEAVAKEVEPSLRKLNEKLIKWNERLKW